MEENIIKAIDEARLLNVGMLELMKDRGNFKSIEEAQEFKERFRKPVELDCFVELLEEFTEQLEKNNTPSEVEEIVCRLEPRKAKAVFRIIKTEYGDLYIDMKNKRFKDDLIVSILLRDEPQEQLIDLINSINRLKTNITDTDKLVEYWFNTKSKRDIQRLKTQLRWYKKRMEKYPEYKETIEKAMEDIKKQISEVE